MQAKLYEINNQIIEQKRLLRLTTDQQKKLNDAAAEEKRIRIQGIKDSFTRINDLVKKGLANAKAAAKARKKNRRKK